MPGLRDGLTSVATPIVAERRVGLAAMETASFAGAAAALFDEGIVEQVEWSFDTMWGRPDVPPWLTALLDEFAAAGRLDGHGVSFSVLSVHPRQDAWLDQLDAELAARPYRRVSEHVGVHAAGRHRHGSPMPLPHVPAVVEVGRDRLGRLGDVVGAPVGLENLATSLTRADGLDHGRLLDDLLDPTDGWQVLDLHNLWCQAVNLGIDPVDLLASHRPTRVRELHVSGGSWWTAPSGRRLRRDTHDGSVPDEVLALLDAALRRFDRVDTVVVERIGRAFSDHPDAEDNRAFRADYREVHRRCHTFWATS